MASVNSIVFITTTCLIATVASQPDNLAFRRMFHPLYRRRMQRLNGPGPVDNDGGPWNNNQRPWNNNQGPWNNNQRPWNNNQGSWSNNQGPWNNNRRPWNNNRRPWDNNKRPWNNDQRPWNSNQGNNNPRPWNNTPKPFDSKQEALNIIKKLFSNRGPSNDRGPFNNQGPSENQGPFNNQGPSENQGPFNNQRPFNNRGPPNRFQGPPPNFNRRFHPLHRRPRPSTQQSNPLHDMDFADVLQLLLLRQLGLGNNAGGFSPVFEAQPVYSMAGSLDPDLPDAPDPPAAPPTQTRRGKGPGRFSRRRRPKT